MIVFDYMAQMGTGMGMGLGLGWGLEDCERVYAKTWDENEWR